MNIPNYYLNHIFYGQIMHFIEYPKPMVKVLMNLDGFG